MCGRIVGQRKFLLGQYRRRFVKSKGNGVRGKKAQAISLTEETAPNRRKCRVSKIFFAWLHTFEELVKIIEPKPIWQQFKEFISGILAKIECPSPFDIRFFYKCLHYRRRYGII